MPEQGHLLLKWTLGIDHPVGQVGLVDFQGVHFLPVDEAALEDVHFQVRLAFGIEQLFDGRFVPLGGATFQFLIRRTKPGAAHQVSH